MLQGRKILQLENDLKDKELQIVDLKKLLADSDRSAVEIIERILRNGIEWYNYKDLDYSARTSYWNDAQALLKNPVFKNELNAYITSIIKHIALDSRSHEETMSNRTLIVGLEAFKERLEGIENPNKEIDENELHEPI